MRLAGFGGIGRDGVQSHVVRTRCAIGCRTRQSIVAALFLAACAAFPAWSQDQETNAWPAVDVWVKRDPSTRFLFMGKFSIDKLGGTRERSFGAAIDRKLGANWSVRGGVREVLSSSEFRDSREHRVILDLSYTHELPHGWKFRNRNRIDMRWVEGKSYSTRVRERVLFERDSQVLERVTWYGSHELYYDDRYHGISRTRTILGASWRINQHVSLDAYGARQRDHAPEPSRTTEVGFVLGLYFDASAKAVTGDSRTAD